MTCRATTLFVSAPFVFSIAAFAWGCAAEATDTKHGTGGASGTTDSSSSTVGTGSATAGVGGSGTGPATGTGTGTATGTGTGSGGAGGGGNCGLDATAVISDFELGTAKENVAAGRDGSWFLYNDKTATGVQTPPKSANMPLAAEA